MMMSLLPACNHMHFLVKLIYQLLATASNTTTSKIFTDYKNEKPRTQNCWCL